jgi:DNA-binding helix-hairpin-helix protein with protein kinase domain
LILPIVKTYKAIAAGYSMAIAESRQRLEETFKVIASRQPIIKEAVKRNVESFDDRLRENLTDFISNSATAVLTQDPKERNRAIQDAMQFMPGLGTKGKVLGGFQQKQLKRTLKSTKVEEIVPEEITGAAAPTKFPSDSAVLRRRSVKRVK